MIRQGCVNYAREWRHFSLPGFGGPAYDLQIPRREKSARCEIGPTWA
jgi:zinc D-Ala-D-Ala dipeptidase